MRRERGIDRAQVRSHFGSSCSRAASIFAVVSRKPLPVNGMDHETACLVDRCRSGVKYQMSKPLKHPPMGEPGYELYSAFSDAWTLVECDEFYRAPVTTILSTEYDITTVDLGGAQFMYHGTEWGSAQAILRSGMFITGEGTHSIRGAARSGCWCVPTLPDAMQRSNPRRYLRDGHYDRKCTPVVVELCIARLGLVKVPGSKCTMHCIPGPIGQPLEGLLITALHFNTRLMANWMQLEVPEVRAALSAGHTHRICACGLCGAWSDPRTQLWNQWRKSGKGLYYHPRCYARITAAQRQLF